MINFNNNSAWDLKPINVSEVRDEVNGLLIEGESVACAFKTVRDQLIFTNKRIIFTSQKGGLEKSIGSLSAFHPYSNAIGLQFGQKVINFILPRADLAVQTFQIMT